MSLTHSTFFLIPLAMAATVANLTAADGSFRIAPQIMVGTTGFEPGVAVEIQTSFWDPITFRPELFINNDGDLGAGAAVLWSLPNTFNLSERHLLAIGPRLVFHNSDDDGLEVSALGMWRIALGNQMSDHHSIEILASLGVIQDRKHDDADVAAAVGVAYAYKF